MLLDPKTRRSLPPPSPPPLRDLSPGAPDAAFSATSLPHANGLAKPPRRSTTAGRAKLAPAADRGNTTIRCSTSGSACVG